MHHLSKSDFLKYRVHPAYLWYQKNKPQVLPKPSDNQKYVFEQGNEFEQLAQKLFDKPIEIQAEHYEFDKITELTQQALSKDWRVLLQAGFLTDDRLYCRSDVIERTDNGWILSEIKSSTSVKNSHLYDLAFQKKVLEQLGHKVVSCRVLHINKYYKRKDPINPQSLVSIRDVTEEVFALKDQVDKEVLDAQSVIEQAEVNDHPAFAGNLAEWMEIYSHIHTVEPDSVLKLTSIKPAQVKEFYYSGVEKIGQLGEDNVNERQRWQIRANKVKQPLIKSDGIAAFLQTLRYPLYFLDYETSAHAVPLYEGVKPYQQLPFQYSLHKLDSPEAELEHFEYIHTDTKNPAKPLTQKLLAEIGESGTVLAWFDKFERYCNRTLASFVPEYEQDLLSVNKRMKDLRVPFANFSYVDASFGGSTSIKNVLPVLVPKLSYKTLGIQEGGAAQRLWQQVVFNGQSGKEQVFSDLLEYCKLDTLAMVEIYRVLMAKSTLKTKTTVQSSLF